MKVYVTTGACHLDSSGELGAGCVEAESVIEPLAITEDVLRLRGEWELQKLGNNWRDMQATGPDIGQYLTGKIVEVTGTDFGNFVGKIVSVAYSDSVGEAQSQVTLTIRKLEE